MKNAVALQNNLISLTGKVFPGVNELFSSPDRADGSPKWVDFVITSWHCECINLVSETAFTERYCKWCNEIGDVRRFPRRSSIVSFAGVDPAMDESGKHISKSNPTTKRGSPHLRKTLYQVICTYLRKAPADQLVYQFLDKSGPRASLILST